MNEDERSELAITRGSVDAARQSVDDLVHRMDRQSRRRTNRVIGFVVAIALLFGGYWHWQDVAECHRANETRAVLRRLAKESGFAGGEALIDVFPGAAPERVALYRERLDERLTAAVERLKDRDC